MIIRYEMQGETISHYRLVRSLGKGTFGEVFEGVHQHDDHIRVAVKVLHAALASDADFVSSLRAECRLLARLKHPHIVGFRELVVREGQAPAMVLDLAPGGSLEDRLAQGAVPVAEVLAHLRGALSALAYAHEEGVIHRDIKLGNLLLDGRGRVQMVDFGIAKAADSGRSTKTGTAMGTLAYMAPELFDGVAASVQSDLYALGLVGWELLTGRGACTAPTLMGAMKWHESGRALSLGDGVPGLPPALRAVLDSWTAVDPAGRPASAQAALTALDAAADVGPSAARPAMPGTVQVPVGGGAGRGGAAAPAAPAARPAAPGTVVIPTMGAPAAAPPLNATAKADTPSAGGWWSRLFSRAPAAPSASAAPASPSVPAAPAAKTSPHWHYTGADGTPHELSETEVVRRVVSAPAQRHLLWRPGEADWQSWERIASVVSAVTAARGTTSPPPPPPPPAATAKAAPPRSAGDRRTVSGRGASAFSFEVAYSRARPA